ncbi:Sec-independent protein translocase protein TatB [Thiohalobacter sp. IOR34]|uniref:Sec-independent protein translocase protein TatB n=1 Tax=Thiohalobacter sp. IOR34 TaxID=3057176 RepID=UPI0025AF1830|nr:Sec-independent protein translocase protein TatB [Thiohalobacter sp. IOR34]WJW75648.1 Sec-independent protein translocase protein TatB [Thiohalobacter sp. IOR34]
MFDIGFWELGLIMVIALLVVGPERLPRLARTAGLWLGKARSVVRSVKSEIDREIAAEELKQTLARQAESAGLHEIIEETRDAATAAEQLLRQDVAETPSVSDAAPAGEAEAAAKPAIQRQDDHA